MMTNAEQAKTGSGSSIRPTGVLVNFPAPGVSSHESPATRDADPPCLERHSLEVEPCQDFQVSTSQKMQWDDQSLLTPSRIAESETAPVIGQYAVHSNDEPPEHSDPRLLQSDITATDAHSEFPQVDKLHAPSVAPIQPKRNWLERWLFPDASELDKRSGARKPAPGLTAHFWTGGPPKPQTVRDISATGMYVVTEERWYLGTQILITLTKTLHDGPPAERSITVLATAVRWGDDGVGLEFVRNTTPQKGRQEPLISDGADGEQLGQFVEQFGAASDSGRRGKRKR
jgi:hypothetical protein